MTDLYSRAMLTVIAVLLATLVAQRFAGTSEVRVANDVYVQSRISEPLQVRLAQSPEIQKIQLCDAEHCAELSPVIHGVGSLSYTRWGLDVVPTR